MVLLFVIASSIIVLQMYRIIPSKIMLMEGEEYIYDVGAPFKIDAEVDKSGVLSLNGDIVEDNYSVNLKSPVVIKSDTLGNFKINFKLFGVIPFRSINVNVLPKMSIIPCGSTVGVKLYTDGILVIGTSEVKGEDGKEYRPWKEANIKKGDIIESMNGEKLKSIEHMIELIEKAKGKAITIKVKRKNNEFKTEIKPNKSTEDSKYKLGLWVRDSTAGIGTLTFYDPNTNYFGALGHGITDVDTGELLTVGEGTIIKSKIVSIRKGQKGKPGELKGIFMQDEDAIGNIQFNNECGIYGLYNGNIDDKYIEPMPVALRAQAKEGRAYILSNVRGEKVEKFDIEIQKVNRQNELNSKGMIIKITDNNLLALTGGIVQGMSGSPIIQNGKIIGAVTHVFVNDPTKGYGIFIDSMLKMTENLINGS